MRPAATLRALVAGLALACAHGPGGAPLSRDIAFDGPDGRLAFRLRPAGQQVRIEDGRRRLLAILAVEGEQVVVNDPRGRALARVTPPSPQQRGYRVVRAGATRHAFELRDEPDGDLVVKDGRGRELYKAKKRDYGFKVLDAAGEVESRIRASARKTSVRDAAGNTYLETRDALPAAAVVALTLEGVRFEEAAALATALARAAADDAGAEP